MGWGVNDYPGPPPEPLGQKCDEPKCGNRITAACAICQDRCCQDHSEEIEGQIVCDTCVIEGKTQQAVPETAEQALELVKSINWHLTNSGWDERSPTVTDLGDILWMHRHGWTDPAVNCDFCAELYPPAKLIEIDVRGHGRRICHPCHETRVIAVFAPLALAGRLEVVLHG